VMSLQDTRIPKVSPILTLKWYKVTLSFEELHVDILELQGTQGGATTFKSHIETACPAFPWVWSTTFHDWQIFKHICNLFNSTNYTYPSKLRTNIK
jgi:hypothetical protein